MNTIYTNDNNYKDTDVNFMCANNETTILSHAEANYRNNTSPCFWSFRAVKSQPKKRVTVNPSLLWIDVICNGIKLPMAVTQRIEAFAAGIFVV